MVLVMALKYKTTQVPKKRIGSSIIAFIIMIILFLFENLLLEEKLLLFTVAVVIGSYYFSIEALEAIFEKHKITIDVLMVLAYLGAGILGQFADATMLIFLYSITETIESVTLSRTRNMIYSLVKSMPPTCILITDKGETEVEIDTLQPNNVILVKAGSMIPVDGIIVKGSAYIDESSLTGEFLPVFKSINGLVYAGTLVTDSLLTIKVTKPISESTVAKLIRSVEEAQKHKHPLDLLVNKFTKYYNPLIVGASALILLLGFIVGDIYTFGIMAASFLVAGAPCALAIGTPVTVIAAIGSAGKNGILVKGGESLERLADIDSFAFDKTGTLTLGKPDLKDIIVFEKTKKNILAIAAGLEHSSTHPYAKVITETAIKENSQIIKMDQTKVIPGYGVEGLNNNKNYYIGSLSQNYKISTEAVNSQIENFKREGYSLSFVFEEDVLLGIFLFSDTLRDKTAEVIHKMHQNNLQTFMLTGDNEQNALNIGNSLKIPKDSIFSDLKPEDKLYKILELKKDSTLAMIGDGINDAPALAASDLGIAMGIMGSDVAIDTADILIMSDDLTVLQKGKSIASKMKSVLKQNIIISTLIIVGVLTGVILGYISLPVAILVHEGSEVLIVGNSLRLLTKF